MLSQLQSALAGALLPDDLGSFEKVGSSLALLNEFLMVLIERVDETDNKHRATLVPSNTSDDIIIIFSRAVYASIPHHSTGDQPLLFHRDKEY
jgi:hypothetical protein